MKDSKLYSIQELEDLKQRIEAYREALTSLKAGTSIEDYLYMKDEFDGLKAQILHLESLTETIDDKQNSQIKGYEEQIQLLTSQVTSLNQTIEEMNRDILTMLKKLLTPETTEAQKIPNNNQSFSTIPNLLPRKTMVTQTTNQAATQPKSNQPSYKMLQSLAGKAINTQSFTNYPSTNQHEQPMHRPEERHFHQQYLQSINTHPSQIYNGLYRNTTVEPTFHFRNATEAQGIPVQDVIPPSTAIPASVKPTSIDKAPAKEEAENLLESVNLEHTEEIDNHIESSSITIEEPEVIEQPQEINEQPEPIDAPIKEDAKKEKHSFLHFLKKWS